MEVKKLLTDQLDKLPILYRTLTVEKINDKTKLDQPVKYQSGRKFFKATLLPFKF